VTRPAAHVAAAVDVTTDFAVVVAFIAAAVVDLVPHM
jgi:hypothetical protein